MNKFSSKHAVEVAVALAIVSFLLIVLTSFGVKKSLRMALNRKMELATLRTDLANLDAMLVSTKQQAKAIQAIKNTLPSNYHDVAHAVSAIEVIAAQNGVAVEFTIDDKPKPEAGGVQSIHIEIKTSGSFAAQTQFFTNLANLSYHTHIDTMAFESTGGKVNGTISMRLFIAAL